MRIKSEGRTNIRIPFISFAVMALLVDYVLYYLRGSFDAQFLLSYISLVFLLYFLYRGSSNFIYDSDGEVLNFTNSDNIFGKWMKSYHQHYEFPKYKFEGYRMSSLPGRRILTIRIKSKKGNVKQRRLMVSYLNPSQYKSLKQSLSKYASLNKDGHRKRKSGSAKRFDSTVRK